jgi:hypothetical protein
MVFALIALVATTGSRASKLDDDRAERLRVLRSVPYTSLTDDVVSGESGILVHNRDEAYGGYNIYCSRVSPEVFLMDMNGGVVHRWTYPGIGEGIWDEAILIFDNGYRREYSKVIELNPVTESIEWHYMGTPRKAFFTSNKGSAQRLPNGNTLICQGNAGRAFEVTMDGRVVWDWPNPMIEDDRRAFLTSAGDVPSLADGVLRFCITYIYVTVILGAILGLAWTRYCAEKWLVVGMLLTFTAVYLVTISANTRLRLPLEALLIMFAAEGYITAQGFLRKLRDGLSQPWHIAPPGARSLLANRRTLLKAALHCLATALFVYNTNVNLVALARKWLP